MLGDDIGRPKLDSKEKFWKKTDKRSDNECWVFLGAKDKDGYGQFWDGDNKIMTRAHVFSAKIHLGNKPNNMCVCHKCDNPICVNPNHLFFGTALDNQNDKMTKNRHAKGESQGHSKLTNEQIAEIRLRANDNYKVLCEEFNIVPSTVYRIWHKESWKHL
jgi:hypothetical protein